MGHKQLSVHGIASGCGSLGYPKHWQWFHCSGYVISLSSSLAKHNFFSNISKPDAYTTSDIICHLNATNAKGHAVVAAGDRVFLQWTDWPDSHHGPVIDYLASCGSTGCETVDKTTLKFFKIDGVGLVDDKTVPGTWGDDQLVAQNSGWMVEIPPDIAPGNYVLRHELYVNLSDSTREFG